ncbi:exo-beta-N-acetylmuramidase NamZ domain-containing protein [Novosphingobium aquiterrae]|uniref:Exo-beta-N-acetylmuramidase NamZ domain-containing protein n=1 Tax=Novosphingobium aquiterrae TaxID=624388 RepID=A0ABV6PJ96_9SPHN
MTVAFGIDRLLADPALRRPLEGKRVALVAHPASVTADLTHSLDALIAAGLNVTSAFGPQHGLKGDKQDNMVETADELDQTYKIPIFSLYGEVRRPSGQMMSTADVFLFDLQDLGCRIYTFVTTLLYLLEAAHGTGKAVWVLDRPNPAGRPIEGTTLLPGQESFVGAGPMPMRHGLTLGEMGHWFIQHFKLDVDYRVIAMEGWQPDGAGFGWPESRIWINPSPNAASINMARAYAGTVMLEGATLSEGRGTTRPLEVLFGAPDIDAKAVLADMRKFAPQWLDGCALRECWFTPTFHKHAGALCNGLMIHAEGTFYDHHAFRPWRLQALAFKAIRRLYPEYEIWRDFPYEYEFNRLAIDVINGGPALREWVDDPDSAPVDLEAAAGADEAAWAEVVSPFLLY